jgi:hypothetical protein
VSETQKNSFGFGRYLMRLLLEEGDIVPEAKLLAVKPKRFKLAKEMTSYLNLYLPRAQLEHPQFELKKTYKFHVLANLV